MSTSGIGGTGGPRGFDDLEQAGDADRAGETQAAGFPRSGWKDQEALGRAVRTAEGGVERSRPNQRMKWVDAKRSGGTSSASATRGPASLQVSTYGKGGASGAKHAGSPSAPVIAMKYGGPWLHPGGGDVNPTKPPVIAMKYGGPTVNPGGGVHHPPAPVIAMKYGGPTRPHGDHDKPPAPVIVMKYGGPTVHPGGGGGQPPHPVIVMKYGGPTMRPRE